METKLYKILNERLEDYKTKIEYYNEISDFNKAAEYSFKSEEIIRTQMLMLELDKEVSNG